MKENTFIRKSNTPLKILGSILLAIGNLLRRLLRGFMGLSTSLRSLVLVVAVVFIASLAFGFRGIALVRSRPVKFGMEDIGELATQAGYFTSVQVIKEHSELWGMQIPLTQSKYIFSYDGTLKAGLDFSDILIDVNNRSHVITVTIPEMRILSVEVDPNSLEIYDETRNIFNPLDLSDVNLSLVDMQNEIRQTAIDNGILENARANAEVLIRGFLAGSFDLTVYTIAYK